jgi:hypothetical protein
LDLDIIEEQARYTSGVYMPKKGAMTTTNNQQMSRFNFVINQDLAKKEMGIKDYLNTFKKVNNKSFVPTVNILEWDTT